MDYDRSFPTKPKIIEQKHNFLDSTNSYEINPESSFEIEEGSENSEIGSYFQTSFIPNEEENEIGLIVLWSHTGEKTSKYSKNLWKEGINGEKADWGWTQMTQLWKDLNWVGKRGICYYLKFMENMLYLLFTIGKLIGDFPKQWFPSMSLKIEVYKGGGKWKKHRQFIETVQRQGGSQFVSRITQAKFGEV